MIIINRIRMANMNSHNSARNKYSIIDMSGEHIQSDMTISQYLKSQFSIEIDYAHNTIEYFIDQYDSVDFDEFLTKISDLDFQSVIFNFDRINFIYD